MIFRLSKTEYLSVKGNLITFLMYKKSFEPFGKISKKIWNIRIKFIELYVKFFHRKKITSVTNNSCIVKLKKNAYYSNKSFKFVLNKTDCYVLIEISKEKYDLAYCNIAEFESGINIIDMYDLSPKIYEKYAILNKFYIKYEFINGKRAVCAKFDSSTLDALINLNNTNTIYISLIQYVKKFNIDNYLYQLLVDYIDKKSIYNVKLSIGVTHGDFAPYNIFYKADRIKIIDWNDCVVGEFIYYDAIYYHVAVCSELQSEDTEILFERIKSDTFKLSKMLNIPSDCVVVILIIDLYSLHNKICLKYPNDSVTLCAFKLLSFVVSNIHTILDDCSC